MRQLIILSVIIALTLVPVVGMAQTNWEKYPANPVLGLGKGGRWDDADVLHPSVVFDGSKFHLWYAGDSGSHSNIGYAWSEDGIVWEKYTGNPVLKDGAGRVWDGEFVTHPSVLYDGVQYRMWYAGYGYAGDDRTNMRIGYATSYDGIVWNKHDSNPVLDLGASGSWDAMGVSGPTVLLDGNTYHMWYTGYDGTNTRIGYATSDDGIIWNKYDTNPVLDLGASGSWEAMEVRGPMVLLDGNTYHMWYTGYDRANGRIGLSYTGCAANVTAHAHANPATYEAISPDGAEVILDGSGSIGSDGNPITDEAAYEWDFEYDGTFQPNATGKTVTNVYLIGEHTAALRVTDSGESSIDTVNIKVEDTRPPIVKLLSPHGGEVYQGGIDVAILWESATDIVSQNNNAIALYYNVDGGDWQLIADNETNGGEYDWTLPALNNANVKVKIEATDAAGNTGSDTSAGSFTLDSQAAVVELTAPNGGETLRGGSLFSITWQLATDNLGLTDASIRLSYSIDGTTWELIAEGERNDGQFDWDVPTLDSENLFVQIEAIDRAGNIGADISDSSFSVDNTQPTVVLTYPNGGETLRGGDNINITWEPAVDTHLADNPISLFYSLVGLDGWIPIAQNLPNNGSYTWSIPRVNSQLVHIKVVAIDLVDNIGEDISDAEFTIDSDAPVSLLTLINPSKEQTQYLRGGSIYTIVWALPQDNFSLADVALNYSADGGNGWNPIAQVIDAGTIYGRYDWNVPAIDSNQVVIRIEATDASGNRTEDTSGNHVIDSSAPEAPAFTPIDSPTSQNVLTITGTAEAESQVSLLHNGNPIVSVQADASGNFNFTIEPLTDGLHSFTATAADVAGNVSPPSTSMEVMVDTVAPGRPTPVSPADGITVNASPTLVWEAISDATAVTYHAQVDDEPGFTSPEVDVSEISDTQYVLTLSDGIWFWRVKASDAVGHVSDFSPVFQFTLHTIIPSVALPNLRAINYNFGEPEPGFNMDNFPIYRYWMVVQIENIGEGDAFNVTASISSVPPNGTIIDGNVTVGDIPAGNIAWSSDTYTIELDLSQPGPGADQGITWTIEYDDSSGGHHVVENVPEFPPAVPGLGKRPSAWFIVVKQPKLYQNYPNPWNPETWIPYQIASPSDVRIRIYNLKGQLVKTLDLGSQLPGFYISKDKAAYWNGRSEAGETVSSGIYFYHIQAGKFNAVKKMAILK